mmetsp:Transcript_22669/g.31682  ORF Transcript_22669/g.31682 Transcript_22669/m.31682 type:complete len:219 (-) Transcript_22669:277-933(-)
MEDIADAKEDMKSEGDGKVNEESQETITCMSRWQAPIQAFLRPGMWIPGCRAIRYYAEKWTLSCECDTALESFIKSVEYFKVNKGEGTLGNEKIIIRENDAKRHKATIYCFTKTAEYLDVVEVCFSESSSLAGKDSQEGRGKCNATIRSFSSGFIPTLIPLAPLLSVVFFFIPFAGNDPKSGTFTNNTRVRQLREHMTNKESVKGIEVVTKSTCCSCI